MQKNTKKLSNSVNNSHSQQQPQPTTTTANNNYHSRIQPLRIAIENDIDTSSPSSSNDAIGASEINTHDGHGE